MINPSTSTIQSKLRECHYEESYNEALRHLSFLALRQDVSKYFAGYQKLYNEESPINPTNPTLLYVGLNSERKVIHLITKNERNNDASLLMYDLTTEKLDRVCSCLKPVHMGGRFHSYFCGHSMVKHNFVHQNYTIGQIQFRAFKNEAPELDQINKVRDNWLEGSLVLGIDNKPSFNEHYKNVLHLTDLETKVEILNYSDRFITSPSLITISPDDVYLNSTKKAS